MTGSDEPVIITNVNFCRIIISETVDIHNFAKFFVNGIIRKILVCIAHQFFVESIVVFSSFVEFIFFKHDNIIFIHTVIFFEIIVTVTFRQVVKPPIFSVQEENTWAGGLCAVSTVGNTALDKYIAGSL